MPDKIFVNLPVSDLAASIAFFEALGFKTNPKFTDKTAACVVVSDSIYAMLLTKDKMRQFTKKAVTDAAASTEVILALGVESRAEVEAIFTAALAAGGAEARPAEDYGFMYGRSFEDPDHHIWEVFWMDPARAA